MEIFIAFSPLWWLLLIGASAGIITALEYNDNRWASTVFFATVLLMFFFGTAPTVAVMWENRLSIIVVLSGYFVIGAAWGIFKWYNFNLKILGKYETEKRAWLYSKGLPEAKDVPENLKGEWKSYLLNSNEWSYRADNLWSTSSDSNRIVQIRPMLWKNKSRFLGWMAYWPWSFTRWAFGDLVISLFNRILVMLSGLLEKISISVFRGTEKDWAVEKKPVEE